MCSSVAQTGLQHPPVCFRRVQLPHRDRAKTLTSGTSCLGAIFVNACVHTYLYTYVCTKPKYVHMHVIRRGYIHIYVPPPTHVHMYICGSKYVHMYVFSTAHTYIWTRYSRTYTCRPIYVHVYVFGPGTYTCSYFGEVCTYVCIWSHNAPVSHPSCAGSKMHFRSLTRQHSCSTQARAWCLPSGYHPLGSLGDACHR